MKIGIDARFVGPQGTGLGKYTEKLIENLSIIDSTNQYVIFLSSEGSKQSFGWGSNSNFKIKVVDIPWYSVAEQRKLPKIFKEEKLDLLHVPHFNVPIFYHGKVVVTIHDLIHHSFSKNSTTTKNPLLFKLKRFAYKKVIAVAIKNSKKIIVPSNYVKSQVLEEFKVDDAKVVVTYEAAEEEYIESGVPNSSILKKYKIAKPFVIYVGNAYPHKNLNNLLEAIKLLDTNLVIVCSRDIFAKRLQEKIEELKISDRVTITGYITAEELTAIFKNAEAYIFPTLSEGFGIPGLNAMASDLPVICSSIPTLKEIYGNAAAYFDPQDPQGISQKINEILSSDKRKTELIKKGKDQFKKYSWTQMAKETLKVYEAV